MVNCQRWGGAEWDPEQEETTAEGTRVWLGQIPDWFGWKGP